MTVLKYNLLLITDNHYKCVMTIYNENFLLHKADITKYMNSAGFDILFLNNEKITFATTIIAYNFLGIQEIVDDIYNDVMYVLNILQDDKKILHHYPSIVRC